jgi:hypothetical protein
LYPPLNRCQDYTRRFDWRIGIALGVLSPLSVNLSNLDRAAGRYWQPRSKEVIEPLVIQGQAAAHSLSNVRVEVLLECLENLIYCLARKSLGVGESRSGQAPFAHSPNLGA